MAKLRFGGMIGSDPDLEAAVGSWRSMGYRPTNTYDTMDTPSFAELALFKARRRDREAYQREIEDQRANAEEARQNAAADKAQRATEASFSRDETQREIDRAKTEREANKTWEKDQTAVEHQGVDYNAEPLNVGTAPDEAAFQEQRQRQAEAAQREAEKQAREARAVTAYKAESKITKQDAHARAIDAADEAAAANGWTEEERKAMVGVYQRQLETGGAVSLPGKVVRAGKSRQDIEEAVNAAYAGEETAANQDARAALGFEPRKPKKKGLAVLSRPGLKVPQPELTGPQKDAAGVAHIDDADLAAAFEQTGSNPADAKLQARNALQSERWRQSERERGYDEAQTRAAEAGSTSGALVHGAGVGLERVVGVAGAAKRGLDTLANLGAGAIEGDPLKNFRLTPEGAQGGVAGDLGSVLGVSDSHVEQPSIGQQVADNLLPHPTTVGGGVARAILQNGADLIADPLTLVGLGALGKQKAVTAAFTALMSKGVVDGAEATKQNFIAGGMDAATAESLTGTIISGLMAGVSAKHLTGQIRGDVAKTPAGAEKAAQADAKARTEATRQQVEAAALAARDAVERPPGEPRLVPVDRAEQIARTIERDMQNPPGAPRLAPRPDQLEKFGPFNVPPEGGGPPPTPKAPPKSNQGSLTFAPASSPETQNLIAAALAADDPRPIIAKMTPEQKAELNARLDAELADQQGDPDLTAAVGDSGGAPPTPAAAPRGILDRALDFAKGQSRDRNKATPRPAKAKPAGPVVADPDIAAAVAAHESAITAATDKRNRIHWQNVPNPPVDAQGNRILAGQESWTPERRAIVQGTAEVEVANLLEDQTREPTGRRPILDEKTGQIDYNTARSGGDMVGWYGVPSHKLGGPFEKIAAGPKEMAAALKRDKGNTLEMEILRAIDDFNREYLTRDPAAATDPTMRAAYPEEFTDVDLQAALADAPGAEGPLSPEEAAAADTSFDPSQFEPPAEARPAPTPAPTRDAQGRPLADAEGKPIRYSTPTPEMAAAVGDVQAALGGDTDLAAARAAAPRRGAVERTAGGEQALIPGTLDAAASSPSRPPEDNFGGSDLFRQDELARTRAAETANQKAQKGLFGRFVAGAKEGLLGAAPDETEKLAIHRPEALDYLPENRREPVWRGMKEAVQGVEARPHEEQLAAARGFAARFAPDIAGRVEMDFMGMLDSRQSGESFLKTARARFGRPETSRPTATTTDPKTGRTVEVHGADPHEAEYVLRDANGDVAAYAQAHRGEYAAIVGGPLMDMESTGPLRRVMADAGIKSSETVSPAGEASQRAAQGRGIDVSGGAADTLRRAKEAAVNDEAGVGSPDAGRVPTEGRSPEGNRPGSDVPAVRGQVRGDRRGLGGPLQDGEINALLDRLGPVGAEVRRIAGELPRNPGDLAELIGRHAGSSARGVLAELTGRAVLQALDVVSPGTGTQISASLPHGSITIAVNALARHAVTGGLHLGMKFRDWAPRMLNEFGPRVKPVLRRAWEQARNIVASAGRLGQDAVMAAFGGGKRANMIPNGIGTTPLPEAARAPIQPTVPAPTRSIPTADALRQTWGKVERAFTPYVEALKGFESVRGGVKVGSQMADRLTAYIGKWERRGSGDFADFWKDTRALGKTEQDQVVTILDKGLAEVPGASPQVRRAAEALRTTLDRVADQARTAGVFVGRLENYFPHKFDKKWSFDQEAEHAATVAFEKDGGTVAGNRWLDAQGQALDDTAIAAKINEAATDLAKKHYDVKSYNRRQANLERQRDSSNPDPSYRRDLGVVGEYLLEAHRRIAEAEELGPRLERVRELLYQMKPEPGGERDYAMTGLLRATGREPRTWEHQTSDQLRKFSAVMKLGTGAINQLGSIANTIGAVGPKNVLKTVVEMGMPGTAKYREAKYNAMHSGAMFHNIGNEILTTWGTGSAHARAKWNVPGRAYDVAAKHMWGVPYVDAYMRVVANAAAKHAIPDMVKGGDSKGLAKMGLDLASARNLARELQSGRPLDPAVRSVLESAGKRLSDATQYRTGVLEMPLWSTHPAGRLLTQFMPFMYQHARAVTKLVHTKDYASLARYMAAAVVVGEGAANLKAMATGYGIKGEPANDQEGLVNWIGSILANRRVQVDLNKPGSIAERAMQGFLYAGGVGLYQTALERAARMRSVADVAGPAVGDLDKVLRASSAAAGGNFRPAGKAAAEMLIPAFGSQVGTEFLRDPKTEAKSPAYWPGWVGRGKDVATGDSDLMAALAGGTIGGSEFSSPQRQAARSYVMERRTARELEGQAAGRGLTRSGRKPKAPSRRTETQTWQDKAAKRKKLNEALRRRLSGAP